MAQQEEPLYDFPEPSNPSERKLLGHERGRGSLKSISVLDRLLLTVPVWLQLSINPATALHILQREPPGTFLVRMSRTSQKKVLCVRVADDSVPSFVQQFGITEEQSTLSLETSAISFPDLPRLISFYCVSRDVLPFPLELPEAIAKAASHKQLESISHMGVEFWSSHLNFRGPREASKSRKDKEKKPEPVTKEPSPAPPETSSTAQSCSASHPDSNTQVKTEPGSDTTIKQLDPNATLFHEFCPITTRSPRELDCGSGQGALCFINPLFLQSQNTLSRRRMFKRSLKIRVSTETSTMLSPPLAPPPPPPLMPKAKGRCKVQKGEQGTVQPSKPSLQAAQVDQTAAKTQPLSQTQDPLSGGKVEPSSAAPHFHPEMEDQDLDQAEIKPSKSKAGVKDEESAAQLPAITSHLLNDYIKPSVMNSSYPPSLSPYQSPSVSPRAPHLLPKMYPSLSPHDSPAASPSLSPYQSPSMSPKVLSSLSPNHSPSFSPETSSPPSPLTSPPSSPLKEQACCPTAAPSGPDPRRSGGEVKEEGVDTDGYKDGETKDLGKKREGEESDVEFQKNGGSLEKV